MKLDQWIQKLLPKDTKFFGLLEESSENLVEAGALLKKFMAA